MNLDQAQETFIVECEELLAAMEENLLRIEAEGPQAEQINAIFRAAHTIKGSAGVFGFDDIVAFTHRVESVLDRVRDGKTAVDAELVALLLACRDHMARLIEPVGGGASLSADDRAAEARLGQSLDRYLGTSSAMPAVTPQPVEVERAGVPDAVQSDNWHISLRFGSECLRNGMDPQAFIRYLTTFGRILHIATLTDAIPKAETMDPEACYLGFEIAYQTDVDKQAIENAFEFVRDECAIHILPPRSKIEDFIALISALPEEPPLLGEILVSCGALTRTELARALQAQSAPLGDKAPLGEILVKEGAVSPSVVQVALEKQQHLKEGRSSDGRYIRVDAEKLDQLINRVGELVIAGSGAQLLAQTLGNAELAESTATISRLVEDIRASALGLRMVPIGTTFTRFQRVVRDVSRELGKSIELVITGGETELDKSVVEKIGDPLMHLVRNAMDHGIEREEVRATAGKRATAVVRLNAFHDSGSIVIEVSDDGAGLNRERILRKAVERGLVAPKAVLSDREIYNLIFEPGFSTAESVSNLSGRGVGMDVVRRNIEALRGQVELESRDGHGTTVRIRLPLTLASIDGFLVGVGAARYVLPLDILEECVELPARDREATDSRHYIDLRGEVLPYVRLREVMELDEAPHGGRENIAVVRVGSQRAGLVVDQLLGELQAVIKPLGKLFAKVRGIGGSTILGDGRVALILDVPELVKSGQRTEVERDAATRISA